jgi:hypothetical protein
MWGCPNGGKYPKFSTGWGGQNKLRCASYLDERGYRRVSTPYVAVTAENGSFTIEGIPAGSYDIEIWHEILGIKKARVSVSEGAAIFLETIYRRIPEMKS